MSREELVMGLKNAVARGQSLESAIKSFISAGYNSQEVSEAAQSIGLGVISNFPAQQNNQVHEEERTA